MNKVLEFIIGAKDVTGNAIKSALSRIRSFAHSVGTNLQNIRAAWGMLQTAIGNATAFMQKAFAFEKMTVQFKTLVGNMDEARAHMQMLKELGDTPPFSLEEFAAASRSMMVMTDGALGFKKSLELVGDAAAATGQPIQSLAHEVGRAYAIIRDGQPLTRATMALRNMGVLTPEVAQRLQDLQDAGRSNAEIWAELEGALKRYKGAMEETEQTGDGLMGAISSQWDNSLRTFGAALLETAKDGLSGLLDKMKELNEDGTIEVWADRSAGAVLKLGEAVKGISSVFSGFGKLIKGTFGVAYAFAANADQAWQSGEGFMDQIRAGAAAAKEMWNQTWHPENSDSAKALAEHEEDVRKKAVEKKAKAESDAAKKAEEEQQRIQESLAEGQRKIDERNAQKAAEEYEKEYQTALRQRLEEEEKERLRIEQEVVKERERLWRADLKEHQAALTQAQREEADAQRRLDEAERKEQQAWGWYRDRDSWKAHLEEERADAEAQKQFEKDFQHLKRFRDWRTTDRLSDEDELIRRVALAREEKAAAEEYAKTTAEATQRAADALEKIQNEIVEG